MSRIEELQKRLEADPSSRIFVQLAEEYRKAGLLDKAIEVCESGLSKHPHYPSARVALGRALLEAGQHEKASAEFESVLKAVPDNILANKFLGETYHRLGRLYEAVQKYEVAHTLAPDDSELEDRLGELRNAMEQDASSLSSASEQAPPGEPFAEGLEATLYVAPDLPEMDEGVSDATVENDDLAPIPLADVEGPMILEERYFQPPPAPPREEEPPPGPPTVAPSRVLPPPPPEVPQPPSLATSAPLLDRPSSSPPEATPVRPEEPDKVFPASPVPEPGLPKPPADERQADMETRTLAELYASQGHLEKAIDVYGNLLARNPGDIEYQTRVDELTMLKQATLRRAKSTLSVTSEREEGGGGNPLADEAHRKTIALLERWLHAIRQSKRA